MSEMESEKQEDFAARVRAEAKKLVLVDEQRKEDTEKGARARAEVDNSRVACQSATFGTTTRSTRPTTAVQVHSTTTHQFLGTWAPPSQTRKRPARRSRTST